MEHAISPDLHVEVRPSSGGVAVTQAEITGRDRGGYVCFYILSNRVFSRSAHFRNLLSVYREYRACDICDSTKVFSVIYPSCWKSERLWVAGFGIQSGKRTRSVYWYELFHSEIT